MPPTSNVKESVDAAMRPFDENHEDEDGSANHGFWDFYSIGGRFAGRKMLAKYPKEKLDEFWEWLKAEHVTVSSVTCGKQELSPSSQTAMVDIHWNEMFPSPDGKVIPCPLFRHSNDPYDKDGNGTLPGDVCLLKDAMLVECSRVVFIGPALEGGLEPTFMLCESIWNGVNHMPVTWDGKVGSAVDAMRKQIEFYKEEYKEKILPKDDWLCVTVDYHS